ncbi:MAG: thioredoxin domain-containing protein [Bacteroidota bacterium]
MSQYHEPNALIHCSSPYLLQHAYNPVKWLPWNSDALQQAKEENKLIIVSIGYSTCHWCHVMEHESFEDEEIAAVMNKHFVSIKVDREERPDIDKIYMDAVQLMTGRGGWPLNCILLPDGRPIYGGTYFHKEQWRSILLHIANLYRTDAEKCLQYASELTEGLQKMESLRKVDTVSDGLTFDWQQLFLNWSVNFDTEDGGNNRSPKFPMPNNYEWILDFYLLKNHPYAAEHLQLTLNKMLHGGIYDQLGGGFCRYSTDMQWKVPHFEKMLYDNAQLLSLYAKAYSIFGNEKYREMVDGINTFLQSELKAPSGLYYSALDADTEGIEGKFYIWKLNELQQILTEKEYLIAKEYFHFDKKGYWEDEYFIPLRNENPESIFLNYQLSSDEFSTIINTIKNKLLDERNKRIRPALDNKQIACWNGLLLKGFSEAYQATSNEIYLNESIALADSIINHLIIDEKIIHSIVDSTNKSSQNETEGFLDDYASIIEGLIAVYQIDFNEDYLLLAKKLCKTVIDTFSVDDSPLFYYTSNTAEKLIKRSTELQDNVIPSSNATMSMNLFLLSRYFENKDYKIHSQQMLALMQKEISNAIPWHCKWAQTALMLESEREELVVSGPNAIEWAHKIQRKYSPKLIYSLARESSILPLNKNRFNADKTVAYHCKNLECSLPIYDFDSLSLLFN